MKYHNELVSVILPVYNSERFISETIESVLNQTYESIELIVIDDCSTDNTKEIILEYSKNNNNVHIYTLKENSGVAVARNTAMEKSEGRFLAFIDSDDLWSENKLEEQVLFMKNNDIYFCFTAIEMIDENGKLLKSKRSVREIIDYRFLLKNTMIATSSVVIDRNGVETFKMPLLRSGQDYGTWLSILRKGVMAYGINEAYVKYRRVQGSLSSSKLKNIRKVWRIQREFEKINLIDASFNSLCYAFNAVRKYFL